MKKSLPAFIFALIASLYCLFFGFIYAILGDIFTALTGTSEASILVILSWTVMVGSVLGIIGASLCFKHAKTGAIILTIATIMCGGLLIYAIINAIISSSEFSIDLMLILYIISIVLFILATIFAYLAKADKQKVLINANTQKVIDKVNNNESGEVSNVSTQIKDNEN